MVANIKATIWLRKSFAKKISGSLKELHPKPFLGSYEVDGPGANRFKAYPRIPVASSEKCLFFILYGISILRAGLQITLHDSNTAENENAIIVPIPFLNVPGPGLFLSSCARKKGAHVCKGRRHQLAATDGSRGLCFL
jgi:hypothetical protein